MTDPNTLESRIARMQESDYQHQRQLRRRALAMQHQEAQYAEEMRDAGRVHLLGNTDPYDIYEGDE